MKIRRPEVIRPLVLGVGGFILLSCCHPLLGEQAPPKNLPAQQGEQLPPPREETPSPPSIPTALTGAGGAAQAEPPPKGEQLPPPQDRSPPAKGTQTNSTRSAADAQAEAAACGLKGALPITLPVALQLAQTTNLDIAQASEVVAGAAAALQRAQVAWLPNFNIGSTYVHHEGNIQRTEGNVIKVNRDSLFVGGGPSVNFVLADVLFLPLAARQTRLATEAGLQRVTNDTLLAVADAYFAVLRARRRLARVDETLEFLTSTRTSSLRKGSKGLLPVLRDFYQVGASEALLTEVERVRVEILARQEERVAALQDMRVASAELSRLIRLDPEIPLWPMEDFRVPLPLPGENWLCQPVEELTAVALNNRPELAENQALVLAALARVRTAKYRPLLPNLVSSYNWGDFGGGPDPNPPIVRGTTVTTQPGFGRSGEIRHMNTRTDFDISLVWRLNNLGFGNLAEVRQFQADYRRAELRKLQVQDIVVTQVVQAYEAVLGWRQRMGITRSSLFNERGVPTGPVFQSLRLNFDRIRNVERTRPLEVLDSIRGLAALLESYGLAVTEYERARFRLLIALGMPPKGLFDPHALPPPPQAAPAADGAKGANAANAKQETR